MPKAKEPVEPKLNTLNHQDHQKMVYLKSVVVKDGIVEYDHGGEHYRVEVTTNEPVEGCTVLINSALEVQRSDKKIGSGKRL
jgi:hypothetical protein